MREFPCWKRCHKCIKNRHVVLDKVQKQDVRSHIGDHVIVVFTVSLPSKATLLDSIGKESIKQVIFCKQMSWFATWHTKNFQNTLKTRTIRKTWVSLDYVNSCFSRFIGKSVQNSTRLIRTTLLTGFGDTRNLNLLVKSFTGPIISINTIKVCVKLNLHNPETFRCCFIFRSFSLPRRCFYNLISISRCACN